VAPRPAKTAAGDGRDGAVARAEVEGKVICLVRVWRKPSCDRKGGEAGRFESNRGELGSGARCFSATRASPWQFQPSQATWRGSGYASRSDEGIVTAADQKWEEKGQHQHADPSACSHFSKTVPLISFFIIVKLILFCKLMLKMVYFSQFCKIGHVFQI
jgi:hypothetical protein